VGLWRPRKGSRFVLMYPLAFDEVVVEDAVPSSDRFGDEDASGQLPIESVNDRDPEQ